MDEYADLIYPDSPFLPKITTDQVRAVSLTIKRRGLPSSAAISLSMMSMSLDLINYYITDLKWLSEQFSVDQDDINYFIFGFNLTPNLTVGSYILGKNGVQQAIICMNPEATDDFLLYLNQYKSNQLYDCYRIFLSCIDRQKDVFLEIAEHCKKRPFVTNRYFLAGIESSKRCFINFYDLVEAELRTPLT